jgi:hypothetical protein
MKRYIVGVLVVLVLGVLGVIALNSRSGPSWIVQKYTGVQLPSEYSIVTRGDSRGGMHGNGELWLVLRVAPATATAWLEAPVFDGAAQWHRGPVPFDIGVHCRFGQTIRAVGDDRITEYDGDPRVVKLLSSHEIFYSALTPGKPPWHTGRIIIIDKASRTAWISVWNW